MTTFLRVARNTKVVQPHPVEAELRPQAAEAVRAHVGAPRATLDVGEQQRVVGQAHSERQGELTMAPTMLPQHRDRRLVEGNPEGRVGLGVLLTHLLADLDDRPADREIAMLEADIGPAQGARLAPPASPHDR